MSKYHGEQYWSEIRHQTLQGWRELGDDDFDALSAIPHDHAVRAHDRRNRARRERRIESRPIDAQHSLAQPHNGFSGELQ